MNIFRHILIGLASLVFITAVTGFAYTLTLHTTVMDRTVVKTWLNESQVYDGRLINALVQTATANNGQDGTPQPPAPTNALTPSPDVVKTALNATFTPEFTRTQIEGVINDAYDWIDGTRPNFTFSIPIDQKRDTLIAQLAKGLGPQIAALPICQVTTYTQNSVCRPPNVTVEQLANEITAQSVNDSGTFAKPINNESLTQANTQQSSKQPTLSQLPTVRKTIDLLLWLLPVVGLTSLIAIIFATTKGQRMAQVARLSRRVSLSMLFIFIPTVIVVYLAKDNDFGLAGMFNAQTGELVVPLVKTILVGILSRLGLITGSIAALSAATWIILNILQRHKPQPLPVAPSINPSTPPPIEASAPLEQQPLSRPASPSIAIPEPSQQPPINPEQPPTNYR
jgi:hypothetical protein